PLPGHTDSIVIGVVVFFVLLTLGCLSFLLYRYMCANRGDYRTTGEPAPGEDLQVDYDKEPDDKKEYFI
uniref:Si:ch211-210c8.7 n=1 Tax=Paramormyrops kingsleyae TaxID=1676925 RepID=A0A3B3SYW8_9TELE